MKPIYSVRSTAYGDGRSGHVTSDDDVLDFDLAVPKEMGGPGGELTNPEQLFSAGYAACFHSALKIVARKAGVSTDGSTVAAEVSIGPDGHAYGLAVTLQITLPGADPGQAQQVAEGAHAVCPYSRAVLGNIDVTLQIC